MTLRRSAVVLADRLTLAVNAWLNRFDSTDSILTIIGARLEIGRVFLKKTRKKCIIISSQI